MDRTSWIVVIICALVLFFYQPVINHYYPPPPPKPVTQQVQKNTPQQPLPQMVMQSPTFVMKVDPATKESATARLENNFVVLDFTTAGAGILNIEFKKHTAAESKQPVEFHVGTKEPILNLSSWDPDYNISSYDITEKTDKSITFRRTLKTGEILTRKYSLGDDYNIDLLQTIENPGTKETNLLPATLFVGYGECLFTNQKDRTYLGGSWYTEGGSFNPHRITEFDPSSWFFLFPKPGQTLIASKTEDRILWASAKNQFFTSIVTPESTPGQSVELRKIKLSMEASGYNIPEAVDVRLTMPGVSLAPGAKTEQKFGIYIGPKEFSRLEALGQHQQRVMEWGWLSFFCKWLLWIMNLIHSVVPNYAVTIILLTILLKALLWYPQGIANRNMKQMQQLSPLLQQIQTKYKDEPEKLQREMLKLYQDYNVNPVGGCLPMFIQLPLFIAFYYMLQSAIELRHASFLWMFDLSQPDTIFNIPLAGLIGVPYFIPVNPMPLLMTATMFVSMRMTPQTPDTANNPMMGVMKFMPLIMLYICYNFSAALSLYWTMQNLLSIFQMYVNLKQPVPQLVKVSKKKKKSFWP